MLHGVDIDKIPSRNLRTMFQFNKSLGRFKDAVAIILLVHLYAEYWLNRLLEKSGRSAKAVSDMKFKSKLDKVRGLKLLSNDKLRSNLQYLNNVRNQYAHKWQYNFLSEYRSDLTMSKFVDETGQDIKAKLLKRDANDMQILLRINQVTAVWLSKYCLAVHKIVD